MSLQYIFKQGADAVVICYNLGKTMEGGYRRKPVRETIAVQGLDPKVLYTLEEKNTPLSVEYLMEIGIPWPRISIYRTVVIRLMKQ